MSDQPISIEGPAPGSPVYRAFHLSHDGHVARAEIIEARSDDEAKAIAARLVNGHGIDLWEGVRFLASYPAFSEQVAIHGTTPDSDA